MLSNSGGRKQNTYSELGHLEQTLVIDHGTDDDGDTFFIGYLGHVLGDSAQRDRRAVDAGHEQASQYDFVEVGPSTAGQETVQLHKQNKKSND